MMHPHNSGSALRILVKFFTMKGAKRYMIHFFTKNFCLGLMSHLCPEMMSPHDSGSSL